MRRLLGRPAMTAWLTAVWVGLWGDVTPANVLGGLAVAVVLLSTFRLPDVPHPGIVRPLALLHFLGFFLVDLLRASGNVVGLILRPRGALRQAVVAVEVGGASDQMLTLLANTITLTPGTMTIEVDRPRSTLYVHVLHVGEGEQAVDEVRRSVLHLERLAIEAVGSADSRRELTRALERTK